MPDKSLVETEEHNSLVKIFDVHLPYEIDMMREFYRRWRFFSPDDQLTSEQHMRTNNSLIEVFCIHARALLDFFSNTKKKCDDAIAKDFAKSYVPSFDPNSERMKLLLDKINKQIFHLTNKRTIVDADKFNLSDAMDVLEIIEQAIKNFVDLRPDLKCETSPIKKLNWLKRSPFPR